MTLETHTNDSEVMFVELAVLHQLSLVMATDQTLGNRESLAEAFSTDEVEVQGPVPNILTPGPLTRL